MSAPTTVKISFWILLLGLVLDVIGAIIFLLAGVGIALNGQPVVVQGSGGAALPGAAIIAVAAVMLAVAIIELIVLWKMKAGKNWARIVITILEVLSISAVFAGASVLSLIALALSIVAIVLLWVPTSNAYFRRTA